MTEHKHFILFKVCNTNICAGNGTYKRCGKDFVNEVSGSFQSPLHSKHYPSEAHCTWNITVPPGRFVEVSFTDVDLESKQMLCT